MRLEDGDLIIVPGDRLDMILGSIAANYSKDFPSISGIVLTGGYVPNEIFMKLIEGVGEFIIPIISSSGDTFTTAMRVSETEAKIMTSSLNKIAIIESLFTTYINLKHIEEKIETTASSSVLTPAMFEYRMFEKARANVKAIVLPESEDERILRATDILLRRGVVDIILLGNPKEISSRCSSLGIELNKNVKIIDPTSSELKTKYAGKFYELRRKKGMTEEGALDIMNNKNYFATMMLYEGDADGMVSGANNTTADTVRPALQIVKTKPNISIVSSVFFMCLDTKVLVYGDCAVNRDPDAKQLAQIAISSADTAKLFGIEPIIAMLSYSTGTSGAGEDVEKVDEATKIVKKLRPDLLVEGPIQYDAAIDEKVAKKKLPNSKVAGRATVFIFPDLNTGNNTYKAVQRSSNAIAVGPVLQGLKKPVNDLSRGCLVEDIVNTVAITAIQAQDDVENF
jgi:phosphate acetyltransferase